MTTGATASGHETGRTPLMKRRPVQSTRSRSEQRWFLTTLLSGADPRERSIVGFSHLSSYRATQSSHVLTRSADGSRGTK